jgi:hypothetical protein
MWSLSRTARALTALAVIVVLLVLAPKAEAQYSGGSNPYYFNNQSYSYGLQLPQVPQPNGQDEIRAADGTTCRSSMASNNAYLDVGGIGGQGVDGSFDSGTVYGRMIIPLGGVPNRLDCSSLYNLEIERLKHELELTRAGLAGGASFSSAAPAGKKAWAEDGWSNKGFKAASKAGAAEAPADKIPKAVVVPMRLQPSGAVNGTTSALAAASDAAAPVVEILPWSSTPAQGARVLAGIASKPKVKPNDNFFPD